MLCEDSHDCYTRIIRKHDKRGAHIVPDGFACCPAKSRIRPRWMSRFISAHLAPLRCSSSIKFRTSKAIARGAPSVVSPYGWRREPGPCFWAHTPSGGGGSSLEHLERFGYVPMHPLSICRAVPGWATKAARGGRFVTRMVDAHTRKAQHLFHYESRSMSERYRLGQFTSTPECGCLSS